MKFTGIYFCGLGLLASTLSGCGKITHVDESCISTMIESRLDKHVKWNTSSSEDDDTVCCSIKSMLENELTADTAVQIALLNNPDIQATFEDIGIAQADLVEAGLLSNPVFDAIFRFPDQRNLKLNFEGMIATSFLDIFLIPLRTKVAATELEVTTLRVANEILDLAFKVQETFYKLQAEQEKLTLVESMVELTSIHLEIAKRQMQVGNINALSSQQIQARYLEATLEIAKSQTEIIRLKEKMNRLLGLCDDPCWTISVELPNANCIDFSLEELTSVAYRERLDLEAMCLEVARISESLGLKDWWTYTDAKVGFAAERDTDGSWRKGPSFSGSLPIFNYGQAAKARVYAELRQARDRLAVLEVRVCSEVREAYQILAANLNVIDNYQTHILPIQNKILESTEEVYNVMGLGFNTLLENKRQELQAKVDYRMMIRDYWLARVELDRALGGNLYKVFYENANCCQEEG